MGKSGGKFYIATIDVEDNIDVTTSTSPKPQDTPTTYLMYRGSTVSEVKGYPSKPALKELLKCALFYYQITNEENLINSLIKEGKKCIDDNKYEDALYLYNEAKDMGKW